MKLGVMLHLKDVQEADEQFANLSDRGFEACQLIYKPQTYTAEAAHIIRRAAADHGIDISAQFCGYYDQDTVWDNYYGYMTAGLGVEAYRKSRLDYLRAAVDFAWEAGIQDIVIHAGFIPNNPFSPDYPPLLAAVDCLCAHCEKKQMNVLLETGGESAVALLRLIQDTGRNNLFVNLDPANMLMYGYANPVDALYTIGRYVRNIHGKDGMPPTDPRILGEEKPVGEGRVDFYAMFRALKALGYDRYIIIEREITGDQQQKDILKARQYFETMLETIYGEKRKLS